MKEGENLMKSHVTGPLRVSILNAVAPAGRGVLEAACKVGEHRPDDVQGILLRSSKIRTANYPNLLAVARAGVGVDNIDRGDISEATARGIPVFYAPGANANSVAELVFTLLGACARNIFPARSFVRDIDPHLEDAEIDKLVEAEKKRFRGFELFGKTLGIIGLGNIGRLVAKGAIARGMHVVACDPLLSEEGWEQLDPGITRVAGIYQIFRRSDVVSVHVTSTSETRHLINAGNIPDIKDGAILMNLSREPICDEDAVLPALEARKIGCFITDFPTVRTAVHPNVICMPHLGASTGEAEERSAVMAAKQLSDYLQFGVVVNAVNFPNMEVRPQVGIPMRLAVPHRNMPGKLKLIGDIIGETGVNISAMHNVTGGEIGYCVVDLDSTIPDNRIDFLNGHDGILGVLAFHF
jgi:D-3-phosphoglycerate dehydrogenase / 2-oxoglutarate reductase